MRVLKWPVILQGLIVGSLVLLVTVVVLVRSYDRQTSRVVISAGEEDMRTAGSHGVPKSDPDRRAEDKVTEEPAQDAVITAPDLDRLFRGLYAKSLERYRGVDYLAQYPVVPPDVWKSVLKMASELASNPELGKLLLPRLSAQSVSGDEAALISDILAQSGDPATYRKVAVALSLKNLSDNARRILMSAFSLRDPSEDGQIVVDTPAQPGAVVVQPLTFSARAGTRWRKAIEVGEVKSTLIRVALSTDESLTVKRFALWTLTENLTSDLEVQSTYRDILLNGTDRELAKSLHGAILSRGNSLISLDEMTASSHSDLRVLSAGARMMTRDPKEAQALMTLTADPASEVRAVAVNMIALIGSGDLRSKLAVTARISSILKSDPDEFVRAKGAQFLVPSEYGHNGPKEGSSETRRALLEAAEGDSASSVRKAAIEALGNHGSLEDIPRLRSFLESTSGASFKSEIEKTIANITKVRSAK